MLERIKILLNITDTSQDNIINILIDNCNYLLENMGAREPYPDALIIQMVCELYNKLDAMGASSASYGGITESYLDDFSAPIRKQINLLRRVKFV